MLVKQKGKAVAAAVVAEVR